ncbi:homeobox protein 4-like [Vanessa atalanta]|uniref:homeobox protein 4-like n=1 Tax=Vanessa atalanta TaxID=42275 RepID=UPI001FCD9844|nr:homeobox protein 4-like [Vanessa atalanta]
MQIIIVLCIILMRHVLIGITFEVGVPKRDSISSKNIVIGIFGFNADGPNSPIENHNEKIFRITKKDNFYERILADLYYNENIGSKPLVQIQPLATKLITRPYYPILFKKLSSKCCVERGNNLWNNNRFVKHYVPENALLTASKSVPSITNNERFFVHKDNLTIVDIDEKNEVPEQYLYNQSRVNKTNQEQAISVSNQINSDIKTEKNIPADNSKNQLAAHLSQLKNVENDDLNDIKIHEKEMTSSMKNYEQIEEVINTTDRQTVSVDIEQNNQKNVISLNYTKKKLETVHSNNNINIYNTTEQSKINEIEKNNKNDSMSGILKTKDVWPQLYSSLTKINTSISLRAFQNVMNDFMTSDLKSKNVSSQQHKYVKENLVKQRIIMNSDNFNDDNIAYIKNKLSLSNVATLDKPIPSDKPFLDSNDDSETLENKYTRLSLKERGDIPNI